MTFMNKVKYYRKHPHYRWMQSLSIMGGMAFFGLFVSTFYLMPDPEQAQFDLHQQHGSNLFLNGESMEKRLKNNYRDLVRLYKKVHGKTKLTKDEIYQIREDAWLKTGIDYKLPISEEDARKQFRELYPKDSL